MAVEYRLLHRFEASMYMENALREAAAKVAAQRRRLMPVEEPSEPAAALEPRQALRLWLADDDR